MARNPEWGKVKTRIAKATSHWFAFHCYQYLFSETLSIARKTNSKKFLFLSDYLPEQTHLDKDFEYHLQKGQTLGERLSHAVMAVIDSSDKIVIIGSDCIDLEEETIEKAFRYLDQVDVVLGPAYDGGFYLIGLKKKYPFLFSHKSWGSSHVFTELMDEVNHHHLSYALLKPLHDVDVVENIPSFIMEKIHDIRDHTRA